MSREIPYQPMGKRKAVSFSRMQEILSKHAQRVGSEVKASGVSSESTAISRPKSSESLGTERPKPLIDWRRVDTDAMESTDGYRVFRELAGNSYRYMAFFGKTGGSRMSVCVGSFVSFEQAKLGCDAHRQSTLRPHEPLRGTEPAAQVAEKEPDVATEG